MNIASKGKTLDELSLYVSKLISKESGNVLGLDQQAMVTSRLKKRMLDLGGISSSEYYLYIEEHFEEEISHLVSLLTTHHTFFFREFYHFEYILENMHKTVAQVKAQGRKTINVFSAACSKGQEVYSLAMFFDKYLKTIDPSMSFHIHGSDIDPDCIKEAQNGVYPYQDIKKIPSHFLKGNWQRGTGKISEYVRVKKHLKDKCSFSVENLFEMSTHQKYDIVFCRNVFIYFKPEDIKSIVESFRKILNKGAYFITGLCESLKKTDFNDFYTLGTSVYTFTNPEPELLDKVVADSQATRIVHAVRSVVPRPIRLLIVDDSKSVQKLLGRIFNSDEEFEVVGVANDGLEAEEFLKHNKVDAMTLDIHMPNKDGVQYLKDNMSSSHPKVVVVSSASRDDLKYAQRTLAYGASDFIEKPALNNLAKKSEEIKTKIKMSFFNSSDVPARSQVDEDFSKNYIITEMSQKARVIVTNYSSIKSVGNYLDEFDGNQPPTLILAEGNEGILDLYKEELKVDPFYRVHVLDEVPSEFLNNHIYICDFDKFFKEKTDISSRKVSICIFGACSDEASSELISFETAQLLLEDLGEIQNDLTEIATDIFPATSFYHVSTEYLAGDES